MVNKIIRSFPKQKLGIGLKKFSAKSIAHIIKVFESLEDPNIGHKTLSFFISCGVHNSAGLHDEKPSLTKISDKIFYSKNLENWGDKFGIHVMHESWLQTKPRASSKTQVRCEFDRRMHQRGRNKGGVLVSNFYCTFECPFARRTNYLRPNEEMVTIDFSGIRLIGQKRQHNRVRPDGDEIMKTFAQKIAAGVANAAAKRLKKLLILRRGEQKISHEHIAAVCGNDSDLLQNLREHDMNMILTHNEKISTTLKTTLKENVPMPKYQQTTEEKRDLPSPCAILDREIERFVESYTKLVNLSYCEVPLLGSRPPSSFVPEYCVHGETLQEKDCFWKGRPLLVHATRRLHEKAERERLMTSRLLVVPGKKFTLVFILSLWVFVSWLCMATTEKCLQYIHPMHSLVFLFALSQGFAIWSLHSLNGIFKTIFRLSEDSSYLTVVSCCTEYIQRAIAAKLGNPTPYDQEMMRLKGVCRTQYQAWKTRIAKRDFDLALKRKRITCRNSVLLLTEFAENYYETEDEEVIEGVLPVELSEAEEFLKLRVEEKTSCTEIVHLAPHVSLSNYLSAAKEDHDRSSIESIVELSAKVQECAQFSEGDRVIVDLDEDDVAKDCSDPTNTSCECCAEFDRKGAHTGSVAFSTATLCFVHFDGEPVMFPTPVPIHLCSILDENTPVLLLDDNPAHSDDSILSSEESFKEDVSSDDDEGADIPIEQKRHAPQAQKRARTVEEALKEGGWVFQRSKKHIKYSRRVKLKGESRKQNVTFSKTPSDWRAEKNLLALLRRLNEEIDEDEVTEDEETLICSECKKARPASKYSKAQCKKGAKRRCKLCVTKSTL